MSHERLSRGEIREMFPYLGDFNYNRPDVDTGDIVTVAAGNAPPKQLSGRKYNGGVRVAVLGETPSGAYVLPLVMSSWAADYVKFPGGKIELGESPVDAAIRETEEETGVVLEKDELISLGDEVRDVNGHVIHFFVAVIYAEHFVYTLKRIGDDGEIVVLTMYDRFLDVDFLRGPASRENPPLFFDHRKLAEILKEYLNRTGEIAPEMA